MNLITIVFTFVTRVLILVLPRRDAVIPLLLCASYVTRGAVLNIGPAHLTVLRILIAFGVLRAFFKHESPSNGINKIDKMLIIWAIWLVACSVFHTSDAWVFRAGIVWNELGCYFLFRIFIRDWKDVKRIFKVLCIILVPVAVLMILEKIIAKNLFVAFGGYSEAVIRDGHVRARGPFAHPILAGTVGATCFPMALYLWKRHHKML